MDTKSDSTKHYENYKILRLMEEFFICPRDGSKLLADQKNNILKNKLTGLSYGVRNNVINLREPLENEDVKINKDLYLISEMNKIYDARFKEAEETNTEIYGDFESLTEITKAGHFKRMELLRQLRIEDIEKKIAVDFGSGSWGFACIYEKLRYARIGISFDISYNALLQSEKKDKLRQINNVFLYATSTNEIIPLKNNCIDIFFGGEVIEHIENPLFFLQEIQRVMKPGGDLIITTPNVDAYLYKINNLKYCIGSEHIGLMNYDTLIKYVTSFFSIQSCFGFESSLFKWFDNKFKDERYIKTLQENAYDKPDIASGIVLHAKKEKALTKPKFDGRIKQEIFCDDLKISYSGNHDNAHLFEEIFGIRLYTNATAEFPVYNKWLVLLFWSHDWSGKAEIYINNVLREIQNLYNIDNGFFRSEFELQTEDCKEGQAFVKIRCSDEKDERSKGNQIIFYKAITYYTL
jgi:SAM-dependent methyltransferase